MTKVKTDADILALFDRVAAEVKKAGVGTRKARALAPAFHADQNEWSELEMSNLIAAELEERRQWTLTGAVLLREEQVCSCGRTHKNTFGVYARRKHRNGTVKLDRPQPEDFAMLEVLERHIEWLAPVMVDTCADCFEWGEQRLQRSLPFEDQGEVPIAVQELADMTVMELYGPRAVATPHQYFKEAPSANAIESDDVPNREEDNDESDTYTQFFKPDAAAE